ncbi:aerobic respiration two-component sensor histidine kinase ArcB [Echinimonas agarilytica]|uniref:Aerobic respiration control sensor protein n=1 Tax=Echinimonas agarilytica TaxID=1215918 RepID=A0AA41WBX3_9GAMM|nr:aerobic respiration two-component sensor histidine kinase ArcB [Echinimonas agarilytica]MCM2681366.1 aerobic respiration two-component sensor histidine kinase ArcB [Echinimonas agarilytica]
MPVLANRVFELTTRLGVVRFALLIAAFEILLSMVVTVVLRGIVVGELHWVDYLRPVLFGLIIAPWLAMFFTYLIKQLGESRAKLESAHRKQQMLNTELKRKVDELNREIEEREQAEEQKHQAIRYLQREVADRRETQLRFKNQAVQLRSLIDSSPDLIYYRNKDSVFSGCNAAYERLVNRTEAEVIGLTPKDLYAEDIAIKTMETDRYVLDRQEPINYEQWMTFSDGSKALFEFSKVPFFDARGALLGLIGFGRDVTERKQAADAIEKAARDKTTFISTISHELRTPLNGIVGLSRMLRDMELPEEPHRYINTIFLSAVTLGNIFNDIIDLDKLERRRLEVAPSGLKMPELIADIKALSSLMCNEKNLSFRYQQEGELPSVVEADGTRLRQVLWNLLGNAVKFTKDGFVGLAVNIQPIQDDCVTISFCIQDTGLGIADSELNRIFEMYFQGSEQGKSKGVGTGIGLSVSQQLVEAMGGDIQVQSTVGEGSEFKVHLSFPVLESVEQLDLDNIELPALYVLLVEDIELNVVVAKAVLEKLGFTIDVAMTGQEALTMAQQEEYDLFFLDIQLPDMTGFDIAAELAVDPQLSGIPRIALTANVVSDRQEYIDKGMTDVVSKPIDTNILIQSLSELFDVQTVYKDDDAPAEIEPALVQTEYLDDDFVQQMIETLGTELFAKSIALFEATMPEYLDDLHASMTRNDDKETGEIAHKIKGAAGSIGLQRIQGIAGKAQYSENKGWKENIEAWVDEIENCYSSDIDLIKEQLKG